MPPILAAGGDKTGPAPWYMYIMVCIICIQEVQQQVEGEVDSRMLPVHRVLACWSISYRKQVLSGM